MSHPFARLGIERLASLCSGYPSGYPDLSAPLVARDARLCFACQIMVPVERIELSASPLPRECSTSELYGRSGSIE